jgi:hypothetical protein
MVVSLYRVGMQEPGWVWYAPVQANSYFFSSEKKYKKIIATFEYSRYNPNLKINKQNKYRKLIVKA